MSTTPSPGPADAPVRRFVTIPSPAVQQPSQSIRVETLNIWGLCMVSKKRKQRVRFLGEHLQSTNSDLVLLQEVWVEGDAQHLVECAAKAGLRHAMHFKSGIFGSGLVTISRFPIIDSMFWRYSAAGDPAAISCGDFYAAKGLGWLRVDTPGGPLDVFNTHLHANYSHKYESAAAAASASVAAAASRLSRPRQPARVEPSPTKSAPAYGPPLGHFGGLYNDAAQDGELRGRDSGRDASGTGASTSGRAPSGSLDRDAMAAGGGGSGSGGMNSFRIPRDAFAPFRVSQMLELAAAVRHVARPGRFCQSVGVIVAGDLNSKPDTLEMRILQVLLPELRDSWVEVHGDAQPGYTCHAPGNSYQPRRQVAERIDYILASAGGGVRVVDCQLALQRTAAGFSYSDHFAVRAELQLQPVVHSAALAAGSAPTSAGWALGKCPPLQVGGGGSAGQAAGQAGLRQDVLAAAGHVLNLGAARQAAHASRRLAICAISAVLALFLAVVAGLGVVSGSAATGGGMARGPLAMAALGVAAAVAAVACAGLSAIMFVMGFIADNTQHRALVQSREQLRHVAEQMT